MKKLLFILSIGSVLFLSSCKDGTSFFGKAKKAEAKVLALETENSNLKKQLAACQDQQTSEIMGIRSDYEMKLAELQKQLESGKVKEYSGYFVIVGSFKSQKNAEGYSTKIKQMGYEGNIVAGPNNFYLVTSGTYKTLKSSLEPMRKARTTIASEAWIYFK
ncbi:MAG: SPOR domain-containing protein [Bacteroidales bacterium]|nr:SPOR domain-containing protein [Bacteroidales bacterium]MCF8389138.1 SPOR domain-containing protein [Bacteroidales bacterium]